MSRNLSLSAEALPPDVLLVAGGKGAGKSVFIDHVLHESRDPRVASLAAGLDPGLVWWGGGRVPFDKLLVELPPAADPQRYRQDESAAESARPGEIVITVVNAETILADFCSHELIRSRVEKLEADDLRAVSDALTDQIEAAHLLILNKVDCVDATQRRGLQALLTALNPTASLLPAEFGRVPLAAVLHELPQTDRRSIIVPGWKCALCGQAFPNADALGISTLVYRERKPFHPQRLHELLSEPWSGVVRSRGVFWLASRPDWVAELSQAGASRRYRAVSTWWATSLAGRSFSPDDVSRFLGIPWHPRFGDRRQELVFVGIGLDVASLSRRLDACLLTDEELRGDLSQWHSLDDPFPLWGDAGVSARSGAMH